MPTTKRSGAARASRAVLSPVPQPASSTGAARRSHTVRKRWNAALLQAAGGFLNGWPAWRRTRAASAAWALVCALLTGRELAGGWDWVMA